LIRLYTRRRITKRIDKRIIRSLVSDFTGASPISKANEKIAIKGIKNFV